MRSIICFVLTLVIGSFSVEAQNLVPNPGFEIYSSTSDTKAQIYGFQTSNLKYDENSRYCNEWIGWPAILRNRCWDSLGLKKPLRGITRKYENAFDTSNLTHSGLSSANLIFKNDNKCSEIVVGLNDSLCAGCEYTISFYIYITRESNMIFNNIGLVFLEDLVGNWYGAKLDAKLFLKSKEPFQQGIWQKVSYQYKAKGYEHGILIGRYDGKKKVKPLRKAIDDDYFMSAYIDDVVIIKVEEEKTYLPQN